MISWWCVEIFFRCSPTNKRTISADTCLSPAMMVDTRQIQPPESRSPISLITMPQSMSEKPKYLRRPLSACLWSPLNWTVRPYGVSHSHVSYCLFAWQTRVALSSACCNIEVGADNFNGAEIILRLDHDYVDSVSLLSIWSVVCVSLSDPGPEDTWHDHTLESRSWRLETRRPQWGSAWSLPRSA